MATIQLRLRTWFGVLASCARHSAEPALAARDTALTIITTSLEMLQIKPFGSKRYPSDLVRYPAIYSLNSCSELYLVGTCRRHFIIQAHAHWIS